MSLEEGGTKMKYYKVKAKCGHVGRNNYLLKDLYINAFNAKEAASIARNTPRVKHHHKDAIRNVEEISYDEYCLGLTKQKNDYYFNVCNKKDQALYCDLMDQIEKEERAMKYKKNRNRQHIISLFVSKEWKRGRSYFYE